MDRRSVASGYAHSSGTSSALTGSAAGGFGPRNNGISQLFTAAKNGLFGILFIMVKDASLGAMWVVLEMVVDLFQLLGFAFNVYESEFPWNGAQSHWFQEFLRPFSFENYIESSVIVFYVAVALVFLLLANAAFVGYSFSQNRYRMMWTLTSLRTLSGLASTVLFMPLVGILAARLKCDGDGECWSGVDLFLKVLAIVAGIAFVALGLLCCICFSEPDPASRTILSRPHSRIDLYAEAVRAFLTVVFTLVVGHSTSQRWALTGILLGSCATTALLYTWYLPYYRYRYTQARATTFWMVTWAAVCLVVVQAANTEDNQAFVFFLIGAPLVAYTSCAACDARRGFIERAQPNRMRNALEVELKARLHLVRANVFFGYRPGSEEDPHMSHDEATHVDDVAAKQAIAEVNAWYRHAAKRHPRSSLLRLFWSNHHKYFTGNSQLALAELQAAEELSPRLDEEFFIYRRRQIVKDGTQGGHGDVIQFIKYQKHMSEAQRHDVRATKAQLALWTELFRPQPDPLSLNDIARRVTESIARAQKGYQELIRLNPNVPQTLRMYAGFLMDVVHDPLTAEMLIARAGELDETNNGDGDKGDKGASADFGTIGVVDMLMDDRYATVTISGDLRSCGAVTEMNGAACRLLGYRPRELLGRNIGAIVPEPFGSRHTAYVRRYLEDGTSEWLDRPVQVYALHKSGYAVPVTMIVRQMCSPRGGILFVAAMKPHEEQALLVARDGTLVTCTASCGSLLGIPAESFSGSGPRVAVTRFVPDFAAIAVRATEGEGEQDRRHWQEKGCIEGVSIYSARGTALPVASLDVHVLASSTRDAALLVLRVSLREQLQRQSGIAATGADAASLATDAATNVGPPPLIRSPRASSTTHKRSDERSVSMSTEMLAPNEIPLHTEGASDGRRTQRAQSSRVQFRDSDEAGGERQDADVAVAIEMADIAPHDIAYDSRDESTCVSDDDAAEGPATGGVPSRPRSVASSSHASSTASRFDHIREQILFGSGAGLGHIGTALRAALFVAVAGVVVIAAVGLVQVDSKAKAYGNSVDAVIYSSKRRLNTYDMIDATRLLVLKSMGIYDQYTERGLRNRLNTSANDLNAIHSYLFKQFASLSPAHQQLYVTPSIPMNISEGGVHSVRVYNLWNLLDTLVMEAHMLAQTNLTDFALQPPSVYFVTKNVLTSVWAALEASMNMYEGAAVASSDEARSTADAVYAAGLAFTLVVTFAVVMPVLVLVERRQTSVLWRFLFVPRSLCRAMAEKCRARLDSREALDDGFEDDCVDAHADKDAHDGDDVALDGAGNALDKAADKSSLRAILGGTGTTGRLRSHGRGGKGTVRRMPTPMERAKLFARNQAGTSIRVLALFVAAIAFFCATHTMIADFVDQNRGTATSVNYGNRRTYQTLVTFHLLRELVYCNDTDTFVELDALFKDSAETALAIHNYLMYGNASLGIPASAVEPRYQPILFESACIDTSPADCSTFYSGLLLNGLSSSLQRFLRDTGEVHVKAELLPMPIPGDTARTFFGQQAFVQLERLGQRYLRPALIRATELYGTTLGADVASLHDKMVVATAVFCCVAGAIYFVLLLRIPSRASEEAKRLQVLLLCVPVDVLQTTPAFVSSMREDYSDSR
eukprot:Opistho-1_new@73761